MDTACTGMGVDGEPDPANEDGFALLALELAAGDGPVAGGGSTIRVRYSTGDRDAEVTFLIFYAICEQQETCDAWVEENVKYGGSRCSPVPIHSRGQLRSSRDLPQAVRRARRRGEANQLHRR